MSAEWRIKYLDIRAKLKNATDVAYRLGYEQGSKDSEQASMQQQMMQSQQAMMQQAQQGQMPPGQEGQQPQDQQEQQMPQQDEQQMAEQQAAQVPPEEMGDENASDLDNHIGQLEQMVAKGEKPSVTDMRQAVESLSTLRKAQKDQWVKKTLRSSASQKQLVDKLLKKWDTESKKPSEGLEDIITKYGIKIED